jgi:hypothetical protein
MYLSVKMAGLVERLTQHSGAALLILRLGACTIEAMPFSK